MARNNHTILPAFPELKEKNPLFALISEAKNKLEIDLTNDDLAQLLNCSPSSINSYFSGNRRICEDRSAYISLMIAYGIENLVEVVYPDGKRKPPSQGPNRPIKRAPSQIKKIDQPIEYVQLTLF